MKTSAKRHRRGVLILVVLSMLVLFVLVAVAFVVSSGQQHNLAREAARHETNGNDPNQTLHAAFLQLLRDTRNPRSAIRGHSLLRDIYGNDGFIGAVGTASYLPGTSNQFLDVTISTTALGAPTFPAVTQPTMVSNNNSTVHINYGRFMPVTPTPGEDPTNATNKYDLSPSAGYYNGQVFTVVSGPARGLSTRIVGYSPTTRTLRLLAFPGASSTVNPTDLQGAHFLVNGRPFNGTGVGYNPQSGRLDAVLTGGSALLSRMPNQTGRTNTQLYNPDLGTGFLIGGADESYDAPDNQNMFLAYVDPTAFDSTRILPSFFRPQLIMVAGSPYFSQPQELTKYTMRPLGFLAPTLRPNPGDWTRIDEARLPAGAPNWNWDVDNDGDGIPDSVWVDLGFPAQSMADGRLFKPLFAFMCLDMDGRVNLNAHGTVNQLDENTTTGYFRDLTVSINGSNAGPVYLPRGEGYGPPEVSLSAVRARTSLTDYTVPASGALNRFLPQIQADALLFGNANFPGRYGSNQRPGIANTDDPLHYKQRGYPLTYQTGFVANDFHWLPDPHGRNVVAVSERGMPVWDGATASLTTDDPYELNLAGRYPVSTPGTGITDTPFTPAELERVLRQYDADAERLPSRIFHLASRLEGWQPQSGATAFDTRLSRWQPRLEVTTESRDLPSPSVQVPWWMVLGPDRKPGAATVDDDGNGTVDDAAEIGQGGDDFEFLTGRKPFGANITDLFRYRIKLKLGTATTDAVVNTHLAQLLPPDLVMGLRWDVNRPFGNGLDDNSAGQVGYGTVDEPGEGVNSLSYSKPGGSSVSANFNHLNELGGAATALTTAQDRQLYARYLYVMLMLFAGDDYQMPTHPDDTSITTAQRKKLTARKLAQFAVNAVDFRDSDAIMTPFEYDENPFNGWDVDGNLASTSADNNQAYRGVVWGCEYPYLLLTETLAFHDVRMVDTSSEMNGKKRDADPMMPAGNTYDATMDDDDLDQQRIPQGSLFMELFCMANSIANNPNLPSELFTNGQLDLARVAAAASTDGTTYPVWRIAISEPHVQAADKVRARLIAEPEGSTLEPVEADHATRSSPVRNYLGPTGSFNYFTSANPVKVDRIVWFSTSKPNTASADANKIYYNYANTNALLSPGRYAVVGPRRRTYLGQAKGPTAAAGSKYIQLETNVVNAVGSASTAPASAQTPLGIIAAMDPADAGWANGNQTAQTGIGISVSEPLPESYYPEPDQTLAGLPGFDVNHPKDSYSQVHDKPFDHVAGRPLLADGEMIGEGTHKDFRTAFLQRLANPLAAHHPITNPYITIDWAPIDLTVFNGSGSADGQGGTANGEYAMWPPNNTFTKWLYPNDSTLLDQVSIATRERGMQATNPKNLWRAEFDDLKTTAGGGGGGQWFDYQLKHTLGYLNSTYGTPVANPGGDPQQQIPWLTWNDRPYVSQIELMNVPVSAPSRLTFEHSTAYAGANGKTTYDAGDPTTTAGYTKFRAPFGHLLNFYQGYSAGYPESYVPASTGVDYAPHFYWLFEYTQVPSRFAGTEMFLDPTVFSSGTGTESFRPPFNRISNYRDPGKVNINTISSRRVWEAVLNGHAGPSWTDLVTSRRGYGSGANPFTAGTGVPSYFSNPIRAPGSGSHVSSLALARPGPEATLLRSKTPAAGNVPDDEALFESSYIASTDKMRNTDLNPYFRYQGQQHIANLITTRSNVYAVWITVGYFAVDETSGAIGNEMGLEFSEVERHRAFYLIDRTIPVAFEPGVNHNAEDTVLLRRFIE